MSITEIKKEAAPMPPHELNHLAAWFHHLSRRKDPAYLRELDAAFDSIDGSEGVSLEDYKRLL